VASKGTKAGDGALGLTRDAIDGVRSPAVSMNESCDRLLQPCHNLSVPVAEPQIPFGANFEVTLALPNRG
jgi:hypothetical protein